MARAVAGKSTVDDDVLDDLEEVLITSDVGVETTVKIIRRIEERVARDKYVSTSELNRILREEIASLLEENHTDDNENWDLPESEKPYVILVVGVNGVGKTTTIGKLAYQFKKAGKKVYLGAADTFRAAAVEQICIWGERVGVPVVKQQMGSDPASVAFDTLKSAKANGADVVLIDTAGRLHNKVNLMNELKKIKEVVKKVMPEAPDEVMLVLDGSTGQNAFEQAKQFAAVTNISSLAITKLDGTAKGGVVIGISDQLKEDPKYLAGAIQLNAEGKVEFVLDTQANGKSADEIYNIVFQYMSKLIKNEQNINSRIPLVNRNNKNEQIIACIMDEWFVFNQSFISLDRSETKYQLVATISDNHLHLSMTRIVFNYEEGRSTGFKEPAENVITDKYALTKKKNDLAKIYGKFRRGTIDRKDQIFNDLTKLVRK